MSLKLNLVCENPDLHDQFEVIEEETNKDSPSNLFIKGPYMMAEGVNRNNRSYPLHELEREVANYNENMVKPGRAMGELNHPSSADVDLERACHMVTELTQEGNSFMSSRALGTLEEAGGHSTVRNMKLVAIDAVADPSYPKAFVNGILESKQWVLAEDGKYEEIYDNFEKAVGKLPKKEVEKYLLERIMNFINKI